MIRYFQKLTSSSVSNPQVLAVSALGTSASMTFTQAGMTYVVDDPAVGQARPRLTLAGGFTRPGWFEGQSLNITVGTGLTLPFRTTVIGIDGTTIYLADAIPDAGAPPPYAQPTNVSADFDTYGVTPNSRGFIGNAHVPDFDRAVGGGSARNTGANKGRVHREYGIVLHGYHLTLSGALSAARTLQLHPTIQRAGAESLYVDINQVLFEQEFPLGQGSVYFPFGDITIPTTSAASLAAGERGGPGFAASIDHVELIGHLVFSFTPK